MRTGVSRAWRREPRRLCASRSWSTDRAGSSWKLAVSWSGRNEAMYSGPLGYILRRDCRHGLRRVLAVDDRCGGQTRNDEGRDLAPRQGCNCENHVRLDTRQVSFRIVIAAEILYRRPCWNYLRQLRC